MSSEPALKAQLATRTSAALAKPVSITTDVLPKLDLEDYVPSVRPWIPFTSTAIVASAVLAIGFAAWAPYRVVVRAEGSVRTSADQVLVNAPFGGRVVEILSRANQAVQAGDPLFRLDPTALQDEISQAGLSSLALQEQQAALQSQGLSELARARLEVEKARSALTFAESELSRYQELIGQGAASQSVVDGKRAAVNEALASYQQAREGLDTVQSQTRTRSAELRKEGAGLERSAAEAQRNLRNTVVRAPVDGIVFKQDVESPQQTVAPGQALATITPANASRVASVNVRSEDVTLVRPGQWADLRIAGCPFPDYGTLRAQVMTVAPDATIETGTYAVLLKPKKYVMPRRNGVGCNIKVGMPLHADIVTKQETLLKFLLRKMRLWLA